MKKLLVITCSLVVLFSCNDTKNKKNEETATTEKTAVVTNDKPNILLLVGDDIGFGDLGAYGSEIKTPNMDNMAQHGVRFSNFRVSPVCLSLIHI